MINNNFEINTKTIEILSKFMIYISAVLSISIGFVILFYPSDLFSLNHVTIGTDPNLLSELRAPGGSFLCLGILLVLSIFKPKLQPFALLSTSLIMLGYGLARILSIYIDGLPAFSLIIAMAIELGIGLTCLLLVRKYKKI